MMQLLEMILVEIVEEAARADRMPRDLEIVNVPVPVRRGPRRSSPRRNYNVPDCRRHDAPMTRDLDRLTGRTFDVLVVGGGIYGLTIAYDAAQRGLSVALVERDDFGSGASFNHLRTIHGGLRYLQTLDLARARESVRERRTLARIAPHAVRPLPFALPLYRSLMRGKLAMRAGFLLDRLVALGRNRGVPRVASSARAAVSSRRGDARSALSRAAPAGADRRRRLVRLRHDRGRSPDVRVGARRRRARRGAREPRRSGRAARRDGGASSASAARDLLERARARDRRAA